MKKVMIMTNNLYSGGAERVLQTVLNHLDENKFSVTLYSMHREAIDPSIYRRNFQYKVVFDKRKMGNILIQTACDCLLKIKGYIFQHFSSRLFYKLFIHEKYDIEVAFIEGESTKIIAGSSNRQSRKIAWVHIDLEANPWTSFLYKNDSDEACHYKRFDKIVCVSNAARDAFCRKYDINPEQVITHYNPIDAEFICAEASKDFGLYQMPVTTHIIAVGRLVHQKGFDRLVCVAKQLMEAGLNFQLHIVGDGELHELLQGYIEQHGLNKHVILHGYLTNPYSLMGKCDILVCASRAEGYSLVIAEAMILGLAIVTTECSGPCELVENGKYGILVENSEKGIFEGLSKVLSDDNLLRAYKLQSRKRSPVFDIDENMQKLEQLLDG